MKTLFSRIVPMPVLIDLLTKDDSDDELNETRWNLLAWMLSISDEHRDALRSMKKEFRVACATLLALVQVQIYLKGRVWFQIVNRVFLFTAKNSFDTSC